MGRRDPRRRPHRIPARSARHRVLAGRIRQVPRDHVRRERDHARAAPEASEAAQGRQLGDVRLLGHRAFARRGRADPALLRQDARGRSGHQRVHRRLRQRRRAVFGAAFSGRRGARRDRRPDCRHRRPDHEQLQFQRASGRQVVRQRQRRLEPARRERAGANGHARAVLHRGLRVRLERRGNRHGTCRPGRLDLRASPQLQLAAVPRERSHLEQHDVDGVRHHLHDDGRGRRGRHQGAVPGGLDALDGRELGRDEQRHRGPLHRAQRTGRADHDRRSRGRRLCAPAPDALRFEAECGIDRRHARAAVRSADLHSSGAGTVAPVRLHQHATHCSQRGVSQQDWNSDRAGQWSAMDKLWGRGVVHGRDVLLCADEELGT